MNDLFFKKLQSSDKSLWIYHSSVIFSIFPLLHCPQSFVSAIYLVSSKIKLMISFTSAHHDKKVQDFSWTIFTSSPLTHLILFISTILVSSLSHTFRHPKLLPVFIKIDSISRGKTPLLLASKVNERNQQEYNIFLSIASLILGTAFLQTLGADFMLPS